MSTQRFKKLLSDRPCIVVRGEGDEEVLCTDDGKKIVWSTWQYHALRMTTVRAEEVAARVGGRPKKVA